MIDIRQGVVYTQRMESTEPGYGYTFGDTIGCEFPPSPYLVARWNRMGYKLSDEAQLFLDEQVVLRRELKQLLAEPDITDDRFFEHQNAGISFLVRVRRVLLCDHLGLGKTLQALVAASICAEGKPILYLTRTSLVYQIEDEVRKWIPHYTPIVLTAGKDRETSLRFPQPDCVYITNWDALRTVAASTLVRKKFEVVIGDEAHLIKNKDSKRSKRAKMLMRQTPNVFLLTGTPMENTPADLWHLAHVLYPRFYRSYWRWYNCFVRFIELPTGYRKVTGVKSSRVLKDLLRPFYLRRTQDDGANMGGEAQIIPVPIKLSKKERKLYQTIAKEGYVADLDLEITNDMARMMYLRRCALETSVFFAADKLPESTKLNTLSDMISDLEDDIKVVVFTTFRSAVEHAKIVLAKNKIRAVTYFSSDKTSAERLLNDDKTKVLISTYDSLGEGANLQRASVMFMLDLPWSSLKYKQTLGRISRIGQTRTPIVYQMIAKGTVDENVSKLLDKKEANFNEVVVTRDVLDQGVKIPIED